LGLTVGCARCHDHKFDPIRQTDYYRLQAFLAGAHEHDLQIATPAETEEWQADTKRVKAEMQKIREAMQNAEGQERDRLAEKYKKLEDTLPKPLPTISAVAHKQEQRTEIHVLHRGATEKPGQTVGPRPLGVLVDDATPELPPDVARPRTQLAQWLTSPDHPLTSRVLANRLWHFHFGAGIVATPNDFGVNGAAPSHRELLDHLANSLVAGGWRLKRLHRELVTSSVYRQASFVTDVELEKSAKQVDPDNRLLWRFSRRRLTAEQLRDSTLAVSGQLNTAFGGESVIVPVEQELVDLLYKPSQWEVTADRAQHVRRSIYLLAKRNLRVPLLEVFDQPDLQISCSRRESSTHAPQALEMLNGTFANQQADALAERLSREAGTDFERQVELGFELTTGRAPTDDERAVSVAFLRTHSPREFALALLNLNAFLYVD
ncbi:MAG TPA: DUF1553 domain-containing protein, partial [Pirellulaceae bacterium]|nr:DUF1553 domain-containing protein [Pirellulaceae bacterium]